MTATVGWRHGRIVSVDLIDIGGGYSLHRPAAESFKAMQLAAKADGIDLVVDRAFATMDEQTKLYAEYQHALAVGRPHCVVAKPGWSNHQNGTTVDVKTHGDHADALAWLNAKAHNHGWVRTVPSETWHWEYRPDGWNIFDAPVKA